MDAHAHYQALPLTSLRVWPGNPRKTVGDLTELAASIARLGVLEPLLVRPLPSSEGDVTHEVLAGQCRFLAARRADLAEVPVLVREVSDAEALEMALAENAVRTDVHPLEEAEGIERLGHSLRWLEKRRMLLRLSPQSRAWARLRELPLAHMEALASVDPGTQALVITRVQDRDFTAREFARQVTYELHVLAGAPFPLTDDRLGGHGACRGCVHRSDTQPDLFGAVAPDAHCLDDACWRAKTEGLWLRTTKSAKKRGLQVIDDGRAVLNRDWGDPATITATWESGYVVKPSTPDAVPVAVTRTESGRPVELYPRPAASEDSGESPSEDADDDAPVRTRTDKNEALHEARENARKARVRVWTRGLLGLPREALVRLAVLAQDPWEIRGGLEVLELDPECAMHALKTADPWVRTQDTNALLNALLLAPILDRLTVLVTDDGFDDETPLERELLAPIVWPEGAPAPKEPEPPPKKGRGRKARAPTAATEAPSPAPEAPTSTPTEAERAVPADILGSSEPAVRVWIAEKDWDILTPEDRADFEEPIGGALVPWEGREGWVTALVDNGAVRVVLLGLADTLGVMLYEGEAPPAPKAPLPGTVELRVTHEDWRQHRSGLRDSAKAPLHKQWAAEGENRVVRVEAGSDIITRVLAYAQEHSVTLYVNGAQASPAVERKSAPKKRGKKAPTTEADVS